MEANEAYVRFIVGRVIGFRRVRVASHCLAVGLLANAAVVRYLLAISD